MGGKIDRWGDRHEDKVEIRYCGEEQRFDNLHLQDIYYDLPRAFYAYNQIKTVLFR